MAYVDLNPVRSKMADTPEKSDHTSIQQRIKNTLSLNNLDQRPEALLPFAGNSRQHIPDGLPFKYTDYLELADSFASSLRLTIRAA